MFRFKGILKIKHLVIIVFFSCLKQISVAAEKQEEEEEGSSIIYSQRFSNLSNLSQFSSFETTEPIRPIAPLHYISSEILDPDWTKTRHSMIMRLKNVDLFPQGIIFRQCDGRLQAPQNAFESFVGAKDCVVHSTKKNLRLAISYIEEDLRNCHEWSAKKLTEDLSIEGMEGTLNIITDIKNFIDTNRKFFHFLKKQIRPTKYFNYKEYSNKLSILKEEFEKKKQESIDGPKKIKPIVPPLLFTNKKGKSFLDRLQWKSSPKNSPSPHGSSSSTPNSAGSLHHSPSVLSFEKKDSGTRATSSTVGSLISPRKLKPVVPPLTIPIIPFDHQSPPPPREPENLRHPIQKRAGEDNQQAIMLFLKLARDKGKTSKERIGFYMEIFQIQAEFSPEYMNKITDELDALCTSCQSS